MVSSSSSFRISPAMVGQCHQLLFKVEDKSFNSMTVMPSSTHASIEKWRLNSHPNEMATDLSSPLTLAPSSMLLSPMPSPPSLPSLSPAPYQTTCKRYHTTPIRS